MLSMVEYVHQRLEDFPFECTAVDLTMGNGYDTVFLAEHFQRVYAFDIQSDALKRTKEKIADFQNVELILDSHERIDHYVQTFDIALMNLGYLPQGDHAITTMLESTQKAIKKVIQMMTLSFFVVVYPGHEEGLKESVWIDEYVKTLDSHQYNVSLYRMLNKEHSPYVIEIEKRLSRKR